MPPIVRTGGGGAGEVVTAACRTGLPLNLLGSVATGAAATGAAATGLAADRLRTFARSSAFSLSILSSRAITSSRVADRAAPLNETRQRAAQAVPERSLFFMAIPQVRARFNSRARGSVVYAKCQLEGSGSPWMRYSLAVAKLVHNDLQCSNSSHPVRDIDAPLGCDDRFTWIHGALDWAAEVRADSLAPRRTIYNCRWCTALYSQRHGCSSSAARQLRSAILRAVG